MAKIIYLMIIGCFLIRDLKSDVNDSFIANTTEITETTTDMNTTELNLANSTCDFTNTTDCLIFNDTNILPNQTLIPQRIDKKRKDSIQSINNICTCNLQVNYCDINCCCDPNCTIYDLQIFESCTLDKNIHFDTKYCSYTKPTYINNTLIQKPIDQHSWFCVINSNTPKFRLIQKTEPLHSYESAKIEKKGKFVWNKGTFQEKETVNLESLQRYIYNDPVLILKQNSQIDFLRLPTNFITSHCILERNVNYLKDFKRSCSVVNFDGNFKKLNFSTYFENIKIITAPNNISRNMINHKDLFKKCPTKLCLNLEPEICDTNWLNCSKINETKNIYLSCSLLIRDKRSVCQHAVRKVHYQFYHNGYFGIVNVRVLGVLDKFTYNYGKDNEFYQEFSVEFLWVNQTVKNYSQIFSGNPGYLSSYPILYGVKHTKANRVFIHRNSSKYIDNFLTLPDNVRDICIRNDTRNIPIEFNYDLLAKCQLRSKLKFTTKTRNATNLCRTIQRNIFELWGLIMENNQTEVFGLFGNANAFNLDEWGEILYEINPKVILNNTKGSFINRNTTLLCQNISSAINMDILYTRIDFPILLNQQKILAITIDFSDTYKRQFPIVKIGNETVIDVTMNLIHRINFLDITGRKTKQAFEIPSLSIRLPYDFFYPFIKLDNNSQRLESSLILIWFSVCLINFLCR